MRIVTIHFHSVFSTDTLKSKYHRESEIEQFSDVKVITRRHWNQEINGSIFHSWWNEFHLKRLNRKEETDKFQLRLLSQKSIHSIIDFPSLFLLGFSPHFLSLIGRVHHQRFRVLPAFYLPSRVTSTTAEGLLPFSASTKPGNHDSPPSHHLIVILIPRSKCTDTHLAHWCLNKHYDKGPWRKSREKSAFVFFMWRMILGKHSSLKALSK
jgi:hypothetical protein